MDLRPRWKISPLFVQEKTDSLFQFFRLRRAGFAVRFRGPFFEIRGLLFGFKFCESSSLFSVFFGPKWRENGAQIPVPDGANMVLIPGPLCSHAKQARRRALGELRKSAQAGDCRRQGPNGTELSIFARDGVGTALCWPDPAPAGRGPETVQSAIKLLIGTGTIQPRPARGPKSINFSLKASTHLHDPAPAGQGAEIVQCLIALRIETGPSRLRLAGGAKSSNFSLNASQKFV